MSRFTDLRGRASVFAVGLLLSTAVVGLTGAMNAEAGTLSKVAFGKTPDGKTVDLYVLQNGRITVKISTYGAIITSIEVPDRDGKLDDVVLGFDDLTGYLGKHPYFGATVGRVANRVAKGKFTLNGHEYTLATNNGPNTLHGGLKGFDKVVWKAEELESGDGPSVRLSYTSPDGEEGYPGNLSVSILFTVTADDKLKIEYTAETDKATPVNLSNHSYFNLGGKNSDTIRDHEITLNADRYTPVDDTLIPTGEIAPVADTPYDLRKPTVIGARIDRLQNEPRGFDHNFVLNNPDGKLTLAAHVYDPKSGRVLEVSTTEPGVQFYTGNFLDGTDKGKGGVAYKQHQAICLETQHFPDSINHPSFPNTVLEPGKKYSQTTVYTFSTR
ncbi:aldose epimerase family protein [Paludisphaera borealis]|uniref:aldose epimerase family protein n=1 Tax=Paludisphaera borealis TaxID=1387353 RepID=UPI000970ABA2